MDGTVLKQENLMIPIEVRSFDEMHGVTLCVLSLNEEAIMEEFLSYHRPYFDKILVADGGSEDRTVEIALDIADEVFFREFDGHYSNQCNRLFEKVRTDWIFLLDCDEKMEKPVLENIPRMMDQEVYDCYSFPRKNFVDDEFQQYTFPDYQERMFRSYCRRIRPVHGEVVGHKCRKELAPVDGNFMIHRKLSKRDKCRNESYLFFEMKHKHEMGYPGCQVKENYKKEYPQYSVESFNRIIEEKNG